MKQNIKMMLLGLVSIFFTANLIAAQTNQPKDNHVYTDDKPNISITSVQPEFVIKLKSNPTTGFSWFLREYDRNLLTAIKHQYQMPTKKLMGAPGFELWTFRVKPAGFVVPQQTLMRFVYQRPWEADSGTQVAFRISTQGK